MAANAVPSDLSDGPVLNVINKRLRALRKKLNRITQMEDSLSQGKTLNKEQEDVLRSKPQVTSLIDELEKLRLPLASAVSEELALHTNNNNSSSPPLNQPDAVINQPQQVDNDLVLSDLLNLLYFGSLFDVKSQSDFTATMLTRTHERGCCLTYDYVTDDATDLLGERDLDMISMLSGLLVSRPIDSSLSHKNALQRCIEHARLWLANADQPIEPNANVTYAELRERLNKIMGSDYFTTTPEMKAPVEMAAAANYGSFQMPVHGSVVPVSVPVQVEGSAVQYEEKDEDTMNYQEHETGDNQSSPAEELQKDELETENLAEGVSVQEEQVKEEAELEQNHGDGEPKEQQQYVPRRPYQNQRGGRGGGGGGGRRGYSNGRGGRGSGRGGGGYQNGRNQYYDQPGNYYPRNYYNNRGRGGRGGGHPYNNHGGAVQGGYAAADLGVKS
ncbi:hypothetical protein Patl1_16308 [Pistacia atlantica]|uniref:Uncharacterized protein n=1 Tax=Pistacia atlantica TaxID=434234 RepID=A0ACC1B613_9ROSI|nr:hypothetical protein Patl1_16308 [Pistacia atlantica]